MNLKSDVDKLDIDKLKNEPSNKNHVVAENEFQKLQTFHSSLFINQSYFINDKT